MKKISLVMVALIAMMSVTSASAATKKSSWLPYPEWVKSKKK